MKVYYTSSTKFKQINKNNFYEKTKNYLGFKVGQKNLKLRKTSPHKTKNLPHNMNDIVKIIKHNEKLIKTCDAFVVDITNSSGGIGFEVALALNEKKPILALRYKEENKFTSYGPISARSQKNPLVNYQEYENEKEITQKIDTFLEKAKQKIDTKFILIIPPDIDKYLNWTADFRRLHKAQVVRQAIENEMQKDKDWKEYIENDQL